MIVKDRAVELYEHLERLQWTNAYFAAHIEVRPNTVSRWLKRHTDVPLAVLRYLRSVPSPRRKRRPANVPARTVQRRAG